MKYIMFYDTVHSQKLGCEVQQQIREVYPAAYMCVCVRLREEQDVSICTFLIISLLPAVGSCSLFFSLTHIHTQILSNKKRHFSVGFRVPLQKRRLGEKKSFHNMIVFRSLLSHLIPFQLVSSAPKIETSITIRAPCVRHAVYWRRISTALCSFSNSI